MLTILTEDKEILIMGTNWNLDSIYTSFDDVNFQKDREQLDALIIQLNNWAKEHTKDYSQVKEKLESYIKNSEVFTDLISTLYGFVSLKLSVDSNHAEASKYQPVILAKLSETAEAEAKVGKWIGGISDLDQVIASSELLSQHAFFIREIVRAQKHMLSDKEEGILAQMRNNGSSAWVTYKNKLIATHKVNLEIEGQMKQVPLTEVLNMAYDAKKETRKKAYEAELASYQQIEQGLAAALNAIKGEVLTVVGMRGYESPLHMTLETSRMDKQTLDAMLEAMEESMPVFRSYLRRKAEKLGYTNGLPWYEMYAPVIEKEMPYPYEEGKNFVVKNFRSFSEHLAAYAKRAMDEAWIDVYPKEGKVGGAFCAGVKRLGESRILLNYGNTLGDVITMAHELGHGFHNECLKDETHLNSDYPMPLAETASTLCETIVKKAAIKEATDEEKLMILENELSDCTQVIVDIYSRYLFESMFFEKRKEGFVSVDEIKELMLEAQRKAYGDGLDPNYLHPYMWTWKSHYYYADSNFYNFPYAFGLLFAKGLYAQYEKDPVNFPGQYEQLLALTGKANIYDVVRSVDLDVRDKAFWKRSLQTIEEDIRVFLTLTK